MWAVKRLIVFTKFHGSEAVKVIKELLQKLTGCMNLFFSLNKLEFWWAIICHYDNLYILSVKLYRHKCVEFVVFFDGLFSHSGIPRIYKYSIHWCWSFPQLSALFPAVLTKPSTSDVFSFLFSLQQPFVFHTLNTTHIYTLAHKVLVGLCLLCLFKSVFIK